MKLRPYSHRLPPTSSVISAYPLGLTFTRVSCNLAPNMQKTYTLEQFREWGKKGGQRKASRYTRKQISDMAKRASRKSRKPAKRNG